MLSPLLGLVFLGYPIRVVLASDPTPTRVLLTLGGAALFAGVFLWLMWMHDPLPSAAAEPSEVRKRRVATADGVTELRARGMPLGAMPDMTYEENEDYLAPGESILLHSDGLVEAHNPAGEMFGFPRLQNVVENSSGSEHLIDECLIELREFVGSDWEQEDHITLVTLKRTTSVGS